MVLPKVRSRNDCGSKLRSRSVNGSTTTSAPDAARASMRASLGMSFLKPGTNTSSGSMSKVITTALPPSARAVRTMPSMMAWCPRCTPSNTPKAQAASSNRLRSKPPSSLDT